MNVINLMVDFENRTITKEGVALTSGDYNSTKLVFEFDKDYDETKICEIAKKINDSNNEAIFTQAIVNNEVILVAYKDVKDEDGYIKYTDASQNVYWYDSENEILYDSEYNVSAESLSNLTKVQQEVSIFDEPGKYVLEVSLYGNDSKLTSASTTLRAKAEMIGIGDGEVVQYLPVFDTLMNEVNTIISNLQAEDAEFTSNENTRKSNENTRQANEIARQSAESSRASAEATRQAFETGRQSAESTRASNETSRQSAESSRANAESSRDSAESTRASNESSRQSAESSRVSAESSRVSAESSRVSAENSRASAESTRVSNENSRKSAENTRASNESTRQSNESTRQSNETSRGSAESSRVSAESSRVSAESSRVSAESSRVSAESTRASNEETRQSNEQTRQSNEATRQANELARESVIESLRHDLNVATLDSTDTPSDNITLQDTVQAQLKKFVLEGKTEQYSTRGVNILPSNGLTEQTLNGVKFTPVYENGVLQYININGTYSGTEASVLYLIGRFNAISGTTYYLSGITGWSYNTLQLFATGGSAFPSGNRLQCYDGEQSATALANDNVSVSIFAYPNQTYNNVKVYPMISLTSQTEYDPYSNGASPNPNYPQEIKNVEPYNELKYPYVSTPNSPLTSYDVTFTDNGDGTVTANGTPTGASVFSMSSSSNPIILEPNTTYTLSGGDKNKGVVFSFSELDENGNVLANHDNIDTETFTTNANIKKFVGGLKRYSNSITINNFTVKPVLVKGSVERDFVPYGCIGIKKVNKNLATALTYSGIWNSDGTLNMSISSKVYWRTNKIRIPSTSLVFSDTRIANFSKVYLYEFDINGNFITRTMKYSQNSNLNSITLDSNTEYIALQWEMASAMEYTDTFTNFQIEEGTTASNFVEHQEKTYNFPLSEGQVLMQDGTIENKVVNTHKQVVFNGSENWQFDASATTPENRTVIKTGLLNNAKNSNYISNMFIQGSTSANRLVVSLEVSTVIYISLVDSLTGITNVDDNATKLTKMKTYLSNNNVELEYELATPDETAFTTEQQSVIDEIIKDGTYDEVTYFMSDALVNPDIEAVGIKDINSILTLINNLDSRVSLLE